jgi:hypothetical protein
MRGRTKLVVAVLALVALACGGGGGALSPSTSASGSRPTSTGSLTIVSPTNGEVIRGSTVDLKVSLTGAKIVPLTTTALTPDEGHIHVILDDQLVSMTSGTKVKIPNVLSGHHLIRVEFVATDHGPFDPRVIALVSFQVKG